MYGLPQRTRARLAHEAARTTSEDQATDAGHDCDAGALGQAVISRLFSAGLDLHSALGLTGDERIAQRLWDAVDELDEAIVGLRHLMLAVLGPFEGAVPGQRGARSAPPGQDPAASIPETEVPSEAKKTTQLGLMRPDVQGLALNVGSPSPSCHHPRLIRASLAQVT